ncbi:hypothetical protein [Kitasatospora sp. HPMI-4]|uniref:hypothetical protein n=1 Tax=Kitasatospora sp. HPMI-4 TaxID=3448443 RepID=UPI003F19F907
MSHDEGQGYSATEALKRSSFGNRGKRLLGGTLGVLFALVVAVALVGAVVVLDWRAFQIAPWLGVLLLVIEATAGWISRGRVLAEGRAEKEERRRRDRQARSGTANR